MFNQCPVFVQDCIIGVHHKVAFEKGGNKGDCEQPDDPKDKSTDDKCGQLTFFTHDICLIRILSSGEF